MLSDLGAAAPFALLENTRDTRRGSYLFRHPVAEVLCYRTAEVSAKLAEMDQLRAQGYYLCGYLAYEAAYGLTDKQNFRLTHSDRPLLHFYAFAEREHLNHAESGALLQQLTVGSAPAAIRDVQMNMDEAQYCEAIRKVREHIREGDTYQVNYTLKYRFNYQGSPLNLYSALRSKQSVEFAAYLNFPEYSVISLSPELFIEKRGEQLVSRPMKGTTARGADEAQDQQIVAGMQADPKTLSENVMIVDLMRNDLSRVAKPGSVSVEKLFEVQTFETLHQMVSTVKGLVPGEIDLQTLFTGLFPCGSITGAPKLRTMELIEQLEQEPRGVYTGAIGYITPDNDFCFNVPIRTCIAQSDGRAEMGVGGGILHESDPLAEYEECRIKARFLTQLNHSMQLIESMRYEAGSRSIPLLKQHLTRLNSSANSLGFHCDLAQLERVLADFITSLESTSKVRLLLSANGSYELSAEKLGDETSQEPRYLDIAKDVVNSSEWLYQHKTTQRELYNRAYMEHSAGGAYDVLFVNDLGQITEASRHNIFIELDTELLTPALSGAVLPGVFRQAVIARAMKPVVQRSFGLHELLKAKRILLTNAVRGEVEVVLSEQARELAIAMLKEAEAS